MPEGGRLRPGEPRSAGAIPQRRVPQAWPKDGRFRILSIDGGGIRGVFPAAVLAGLERRYTGGSSIASYFDLATGTSTGGILALGLGAEYAARDLFELYAVRGGEIFPPRGRVGTWLRDKRQYARYAYDRLALQRLLTEKLGSRLFGESRLRLCIPAFEGRHSEVFVFKTPHHPDYKTDRFELMTTVALATSAAPTYFRPLEHGGYTLVDGGVWANNPLILAVIEALICFDITRDQIDVLSIGCGDDRYIVSDAEINKGGMWHWRKILSATMRLQSLAAVNQARLLLGPQQVVRIDPPPVQPPIRMDDWRRSVEKLAPAADQAVLADGDRVAEMFLRNPTAPFVAPVVAP
jgi:patatin-like phospholipase/acyl hydrolase